MNKKIKRMESKQVIVNLMRVSDLITKNESLTNGLSPKGIEELYTQIWTALPTLNVCISSRSECYAVSHLIVRTIMSHFRLMSFNWYGNIDTAISDYLLVEYAEKGKHLTESI